MKTSRMFKILLLTLVLTPGLAQQKQHGVRNSLWVCPVAKNSYDSLWLNKGGRYILFSAELGERALGHYQVVADSLLLFQERGEFDKENSPEHRLGRALFKFVLAGDSLSMVYSQPSLRFPATTVRDTNYVFHRVK
jgi:hypothetical protein